MPELYIYKHKIESIFQLLGKKENDISHSVGWGLANSTSFLRNFLLNVVDWKNKDDLENTVIKLQEFEKRKGFTDFEIEIKGQLHIIIEAKKGWNLPDK